MIKTVMCTDDLPTKDRFAFWHETTDRSLMPTMISSDHIDNFHASLQMLELGAVQITVPAFPSLRTRRTPRHIRKSDPETYQVALTPRHGTMAISQLGRDTILRDLDLMIYDSSHPYDAEVAATPGMQAAVTVAQFPKALLPLPPRSIEGLLARRLPGDIGLGALLRQFITQTITDPAQYRPVDALRLSTVLIDLTTAVLAHQIDAHCRPQHHQHQEILHLRITAFIRQHLGEPDLGPATVAAAHHISLRHLHRIFRNQDTTVAAWIRQQRLQRCHRDLADPGYWHLPIHAIASRWGFAEPAHFCRAFRATFGMSPNEHRHLARQCA
ncbi:helix-turn-helix domain-containing protein [Amycolatopsis magusensis]|uniref:helix-turn-helix domain-containing protein n=1 Tax=Amycolatopsis magusensis TaxID=882444 RepID=UPI0024A97C48|nr:helix-turn-helix domain-containing protein [Amycolatopsis magusensis]MDI5979845.1 helix-turn-helix domain-containing protein [Amycolatopsis magusensis]